LKSIPCSGFSALRKLTVELIIAAFWAIPPAGFWTWRGYWGARMHKFIVALTAAALLVAPAYAQSRAKGSKRSETSQQTQDKKQRDAEAEKAYKDALRSIPDKKVSDPWTSMR
jgi:hypothetical protein